jgi:hypothetical protein
MCDFVISRRTLLNGLNYVVIYLFCYYQNFLKFFLIFVNLTTQSVSEYIVQIHL